MKRPVTYLFTLSLALLLILLPTTAFAACPGQSDRCVTEQCGSRETSCSSYNCPTNSCDTGVCAVDNRTANDKCGVSTRVCPRTADCGIDFLAYLRGLCAGGGYSDLFSLLCGGKSSVIPFAAASDITTQPAGNADYDPYILRVIELVNRERTTAGLNELVPDEGLMSAAVVRGEEIITAFSHTRPDGRSCFTALDEAGVSYGAAGENIASGQPDPETVMTDWLNSPGHRDNILNAAFGRIGVAAIPKTDGSGYAWVQLFAD